MVGYKLWICVRESWVNHGYKLLNGEKKIATVSRQINFKELFPVWGNDLSEMSPSDADQALCDEERHEGDWRRETRGEGGRVWKEKLEKSILSVLISRDCDGSRGHAAVIESCWITKNLCLCSSGLSGCLMKITPHTGLIYFNQIWPKPDKCSIPPLRSSILCPLPPSLLHPAGWIKLSCVTRRPSSSQPAAMKKVIFSH